MVCFYHKGFLSPDEVGPPVVYRFDHPKELEVMGVVVLLGGGECGRVVGHWMAPSWSGWSHSFILGEDCSYSLLCCVGLEVVYLVEVGLSQDWFADHLISEFLEGSLLVVFPVPRHSLLCEV